MSNKSVELKIHVLCIRNVFIGVGFQEGSSVLVQFSMGNDTVSTSKKIHQHHDVHWDEHLILKLSPTAVKVNNVTCRVILFVPKQNPREIGRCLITGLSDRLIRGYPLTFVDFVVRRVKTQDEEDSILFPKERMRITLTVSSTSIGLVVEETKVKHQKSHTKGSKYYVQSALTAVFGKKKKKDETMNEKSRMKSRKKKGFTLGHLLKQDDMIQMQLDGMLSPGDTDIQKLFNVHRIPYKELNITTSIRLGDSENTYIGSYRNHPIIFKTFNVRWDVKDTHYSAFSREFAILHRLSFHPNIIDLIGIVVSRNHIGIVMEDCPHRSLGEFIKTKSKDDLSFLDRLRILYGIVLGMKYLHSHKLFHRKLNPDTILLNEKLVPKIFNFQHTLSTIVDPSSRSVVNPAQNLLLYVAPETLSTGEESKRQYDEKIDVYSFGVISSQVCNFNFFSDDKNEKKEKVITKLTESIKEEWLKELIQKCVSKEPKIRPSFEEICRCMKENVKELTSMKEPMLIYLISQDEDIEDSQEVSLEEMSLSGIRKVVASLYGQKKEILRFFWRQDEGKDLELTTDDDIQMLGENSVVVVEFKITEIDDNNKEEEEEEEGNELVISSSAPSNNINKQKFKRIKNLTLDIEDLKRREEEEVEGEDNDNDDDDDDDEEEEGEIVVYLRTKDQEDEEAEDILLQDFTLKGVFGIATEWGKYKPISELFLKKEDGRILPLKTDFDVDLIDEDDILIVYFDDCNVTVEEPETASSSTSTTSTPEKLKEKRITGRSQRKTTRREDEEKEEGEKDLVLRLRKENETLKKKYKKLIRDLKIQNTGLKKENESQKLEIRILKGKVQKQAVKMKETLGKNNNLRRMSRSMNKEFDSLREDLETLKKKSQQKNE